MRLAVLGANQHVPALVEAALALGEQHAVDTLLECGAWQAALKRLAPDAQVAGHWETLLDGAAHAAIVALEPEADAAERDRRADQLRKLTAAGVPLLLVVPCCEGIVGYELDMIRRDTNSLLLPYSPLAWHAGAARTAERIAAPDPRLGAVQQLVVERQMPPSSDAQRLFVFGQDAHLLDGLLGQLLDFTASSSSPGSLDNLSAHFRGADLVARWSLLPGAEPSLELTLIGQLGRARWTVAPGGSQWSGPEGDEPLADDAPRRAVEEFVRQCETPGPSRWEGACRAAEAADNARRSAERGRAVSMQEHTPTEEDTFKGVMAAGSCGLLLLTLLIFLVGGLIESVRFPALRNKMVARQQEQQESDPPRAAAADQPPARPLWLRLWPIYPFAVLLLLQLLRLVFPKEAAGDRARASGGGG